MYFDLDGFAQEHEGDYADAAHASFEEELHGLLAVLSEEKNLLRRRKAGPVNWTKVGGSLDAYLQEAGDNWRETFLPVMEATLDDLGSELSVVFGIEFDVRNWRGEAWFQDYTLKFAQAINETTSGDIHDLLATAAADGWSIPDMQAAMEELFQQYMDGDLTAEETEWFKQRLPAYRTEMIARTETISLSNAGTHQLGQDWGATAKIWLATDDDRTRPSHIEAGGRYVEGIPIDEPFIVGGYEMMYPGDRSHGAPPSEFVNCRCTELLLMP